MDTKEEQKKSQRKKKKKLTILLLEIEEVLKHLGDDATINEMELFDPEAAGELDDEAMAEKHEAARVAL